MMRLLEVPALAPQTLLRTSLFQPEHFFLGGSKNCFSCDAIKERKKERKKDRKKKER
jgi:hypothetical protein